MKHIKLPCLLIAVLIMARSVSALELRVVGKANPTRTSVYEPLQRTADPLILTVKQLPRFVDSPIAHLGLFRWTGGRFMAVPFQIDEKDEDGQWILPFGEEANPEDGNGIFDGDDEFVFMALDAGEKADAIAGRFPNTRSVEIRIDDPKGGTGFVYLVRFQEKAPRSPLDYVDYDPKTKMISADFYRMGFHPEFPIGIGHLAILPAAGGDGINAIDRMKVRVTVETIFGIDFSRHEEDFTSVDVAYIDGPVRVVRRTRNRMDLVFSIPTPSAIIDSIFYREFFLFPTEVDVPFDIGFIVDNIQFRTSVDLTEAARGRVFYNSNSSVGTVFDGEMSDDEKRLDDKPFDWMAQVQKYGQVNVAWVNRLIVESEADSLKLFLYYNDDSSVDDPPEEHRGHFGDTGFIIDDLPGLEGGNYRLVSFMYCVPGYEIGMEKAYLDIVDTPLVVSRGAVEGR
ncbi:MAG: hypothetical protein GY866_36920 [Proteobacteria bacterium]|nr:hypothetical protein [Pseudomonadota bacterium]